MNTIRLLIFGSICALMITGCSMSGTNAKNNAQERPAATERATDKAGVGDDIENAAGKAKDKAGDAVNNVGDAAGDIVDGAGNIVEDAGKTVNDAADSVSGR